MKKTLVLSTVCAAFYAVSAMAAADIVATAHISNNSGVDVVVRSDASPQQTIQNGLTATIQPAVNGAIEVQNSAGHWKKFNVMNPVLAPDFSALTGTQNWGGLKSQYWLEVENSNHTYFVEEYYYADSNPNAVHSNTAKGIMPES